MYRELRKTSLSKDTENTKKTQKRKQRTHRTGPQAKCRGRRETKPANPSAEPQRPVELPPELPAGSGRQASSEEVGLRIPQDWGKGGLGDPHNPRQDTAKANCDVEGTSAGQALEETWASGKRNRNPPSWGATGHQQTCPNTMSKECNERKW